MEQKIVYQLDEDGYLMGHTEADESPLEPGVFLIPGGCVEVEPPEGKADHLLRFVGGEWAYEEIPKQEEPAPEDDPQEPDPLTADQVTALRRFAYAAESDPLKTEAEYDAIVSGEKPDYEAWLAKVAEIKERYPMPADGQD